MTTNDTTRTIARSWLRGIEAKTRATPEEMARMLGIGEGEVAKLLDESEAEPLDPATEEAVRRLLRGGVRLSTAANHEWP